MVQVEIFSSQYLEKIQTRVNEFIKNIKPENLVDIKFQDNGNNFSAMIIYKLEVKDNG